MPVKPALRDEPRRIVKVKTGYGDASACLKLRTPLIRRDPDIVQSRRVPDSD